MATGRDLCMQDGQGRPARLETSAVDARSIAAVRRVATDHLRRSGVANVADTVLVLSELVTNAVLHGGGAERIVIDCDDRSVRITVHDGSTRAPQHPPELPAVGGRGLHIVEHLSSGWGSAPSEQGKDVWAVLPAALPSTP